MKKQVLHFICDPGDYKKFLVHPIFETLDFFYDAEPHSAAFNMAADEVLMRRIARPMLRVYSWAQLAVSFGYFEKYTPVRSAYPHRELVRRWTGGGVVPHGDDLTYSLLVPRSCDFARTESTESYRMIHKALAHALCSCSIHAVISAHRHEKISQACFQNAVQHDVMFGGKKIAGAAQRRTSFGLLHQGSIQETLLPFNFPSMLATNLAASVKPCNTDNSYSSATQALAETKYATPEWTEKY
jgi:lipoate-protein ligase A